MMRAWVVAVGLVALLGTAAMGDTVEYQVAAAAEDTATTSGGTNYTTANIYFPFYSDSPNDRPGFFRWPIDLPPQCTIASAYLKVNSYSTQTTASAVRLQLVDSDNCPAFNVNPYSYSVTGSAVDWTLPGTWTQGTWYTSPDVKTLVQAYVNRAGYVPGNYLGLKESRLSGGYRQIRQWDYGDHTYGAKLEITYSGGLATLELLMADPEVRIGQKIYVRSRFVYSTDTLEARLDNNVIYTKQGNVQAEEMFTADYSNLTAGQHTLTVRVIDSGSNVRGTISRTWTTLHNGVPHVGINVNNAICIDGTPFFPVTSWQCDKYRFPATPLSPAINTLLGEGFEDNHTVSTWQNYLGVGQTNGWWVAGPSVWAGSEPILIESDMDSAVSYITNTRNHAALLAWEWRDEPDLYPNNHIGTRYLTELTHEYDTNHPVWVSLVGYSFTHNDDAGHNGTVKKYCYMYNQSEFGGERTMTGDIIGLDYYVHEYATKYDFCNLSDCMLALDRVQEWNYNLTPAAAFVQPCDEALATNARYALTKPLPPNEWDYWTPGPNGAQVKNLFWLTVIHGAKAISWFHYFEWFDAGGYPNVDTMEECLEWIEDLTQVILSAPEDVTTDVTVTVPAGYRVDFMTRVNAADDLYIFSGELRDWGDPHIAKPNPNDRFTWLFNIPTGSFTARFDVDGLAENSVVSVYGENRNIISEDGYFEDTFDVHAVHIYIITGEVQNQPPTADAGDDDEVTDSDDSGAETMTLDGSGSSDADGTIASYVWKEGATQIASGASASVNLAVGTHTITLTVTDDDGATASDTVVMTVNAAPEEQTVQYTLAASGDDTYCASGTNDNYYNMSTMNWIYSGTARRAFVRWSINIPDGSTIVSAYVKVKASAATANTTTGQLQLVNSDSCPTLSGTTPYATSVTGPTVNWALGATTAGTVYTSPDIKTIVQGFIDRAGYASGNYLGLRCINVSGSTMKPAYQWDNGSHADGAVLEVTYTAP